MSVAAAAFRSKKASVVSRATLTLAGVEQEFAGLKDWTVSEEAFELPFDEVERVLETRGREVLRRLLQAHVEARGLGDVGPAVSVEEGREAKGPVLHGERRLHTRKVTSIFGKIRVDRRAYHRDGTPAIRPLDEDLELPSRTYSYELQRRVVFGAVRGPFQEVCEAVEETTGVRVSKRSAEDLAQEAARDFDAFYEQRAVPQEGTGPILVAALDGKGVPMVKPEPAERKARRAKGEKANKKRMATVAAVYSQQPFVRTPEEVVASLFQQGPRLHEATEPSKARRPEHKRVWASLKKGKAEVTAEVAREWDRRDPTKAKIRVVLTDGDKALQRTTRRGLKGATFILDLIHALEYLWEAVYCFHPEGSQEAAAWVQERALMILQGDVGQVVKGLRQSATKRAFHGEKREVVRKVTGYLYRNRRFMRYDDYLAQGLPIASGAVEGACKNLVKDRMERSGMRWTEDAAEAMLKLRAAERSGDFEDYWKYHVEQEQQRLHPPGRWRPVQEGIGK